MRDFRKYLHEEPVIIIDGGMGTSLYDHGVFAEFMKHEVPGVHVPDSIVERIKKHTTKEDALNEGIQIAPWNSHRC